MDPTGGQARSRGRSRARSTGQQEDVRRPGGGVTATQPQQAAPAPTAQPAQPGGRTAHRGVVAAVPEPRPGAVSGAASGEPGAERGGHGRGTWRGRGERIADIVTRPSHVTDKQGSSGRQVNLVANYIRVTQVPNMTVRQYHVDFSPTVEVTVVRKALFNQHKDMFGGRQGYLFDGMALFTSTRLPSNETQVTSKRKDDTMITINIKFIKELAANDQIVVQIMNILLRKVFSNLKYELIGRHYFDIKSTIPIPQHKLELMPGFVTAIRQHEVNVMLCADLVFKVVRTENCYSVMSECYNKDPRNWQNSFMRSVVGSIIMTKYNNKTYRVDDIKFDLNPKSTFSMRRRGEEKMVSYKDYYQSQYNLTILDPDQPLLVSLPSRRDIARGQDKPLMLVPELCNLTGLSEEVRNNFAVMKDVGFHTRVVPQQRANNLMTLVNKIKRDPPSMEEMKAWGMTIDSSLLKLKGRVVDNEKIFFANNATVDYNPRTADWTECFRSSKLIDPVTIHNWSLIYSGRDDRAADTLVSNLRRVSPSMGLNFPPPKMIRLNDDRSGTFVSAIKNAVQERPQFICALVPQNRKDRYDAIKKMCCVDAPIPSQVVTSRIAGDPKRGMSAATKIAIQINCKLGGAPWAIKIPLTRLMIVGYDSYHDSAQKNLSVGALCCSIDPGVTKYHSSVTFQTSHQEMVDGLGINFTASLKKFYQVNSSQFPDRIIVYRDGVGEGQLAAVHEHEVMQIVNAMKTVGCNAKLAFIVVTKKINSKLFEESQRDLQNPLPGTVVDSEITRPEWYDFYLISQSVKQGTVGPTHYNVIHDTSGLKPEHVQRLTYKMTHVYYNCSTTIRVPAPCMYAHKLAFLTGQSLHATPAEQLSDKLFFL